MLDFKSRPNGKKSLVLRKELLTFIPALGLAGLWYGWEGMAMIAASAVAVAWMARTDTAARAEAPAEDPRDALTNLKLREAGVTYLETLLDKAAETGRTTACMVIGLDKAGQIGRQHGANTLETVVRTVSERLTGAVRESDLVVRLDGARFAILLQPTPRTDLESIIQLSARIQTTVEQPVSLQQQTLYINAHVGFCLSTRAPELNAESMMASAEVAAKEAANNGPSAIRAFSVELLTAEQSRTALTREVPGALESGQLVAYFVPQICSDTGDIAGFQAQPRWMHPERGVLSEAEILPAIESGGLRERLGEVMLYNTFSALRGWDRERLNIKEVSLPMPPELLANPKLAERMRWELDRFDMPAERLRLILMPSTIPQLDHDVVNHNLEALAKMGLHIELAGFGSGPASVTTIRRAHADRLRIHRSFVTHVDTDQEQQRLIAAIISLAEGLGVKTLAECVSSVGEHAMLTQLGCTHVQGPTIARPMAYEDTLDWIARHREKLKAAPKIGAPRLGGKGRK